MGKGGKGEFTVTVKKEEVVAAVLPLQEHWLPLSNLDLLLPPLDVGVFFCYKNLAATPATGGDGDGSMNFDAMVGSLKKALAQALVTFYAFAGEVVPNSAGEPELLCNNRGVDFVEAFADSELKSLNLYNPDDTIEGKLVPQKKHGVLAVQATSLKCGGLVVSCTFDHRIADAYSANMFLVSWAKMAQPTETTIIHTAPPCKPCFRRSLLSPRRPGSFHPSLDDMYVPVSMLSLRKEPETTSEPDHVISRIYYVAAKELDHMQSLANSNTINGAKRTKLESFCAFLWKMVAASAEGKRASVKMGIVVDGRKRLSNGDKDKEALMGSYFGNVLSIPFGGKPVEELLEMPLSWVTDEVHEFLETAVTEEHFLGLIDWVEAHRPMPGLAKIYCNGSEDGPAFVVSSGQRFPESEVDFGWGKPDFASYHFPWGSDTGYVMPMPSPAGNGDWVVYVHLLKAQVEMIEFKAGHIFKPLTWDYLKY
ncbi:hypothetical protein L6164_029284 [Bauhinia variegata]|uniref:Uncharacterized protein n=1 Tax=Bauhinia variegata TaxID=167791 RepID=A0ACB9L8B5_BAUVA|nr:hypothetical protein L6164_029284 [Bauhinia variegata]